MLSCSRLSMSAVLTSERCALARCFDLLATDAATPTPPVNIASKTSEVTINKCFKKLDAIKNKLIPDIILKKYLMLCLDYQ